MATTIKLKNGSGAPTTGDLVQGEPAFDLTNKRLYTEDSGGTVIEVGTNPTSLTTGTFTSTGIDDNATSTAITIDASENVGIGASVPLSLGAGYSSLDIRNTTGGGIVLGEGGTQHGYLFSNSDGLNLEAFGPRSLKLNTNSQTRLIIGATGNVGIGTTSPDANLEIRKDNASGLGAVLSLTNSNASGLTGNSVAIGLSAYAHTTVDNAGYRGAIIKGETTVAGNGHSLIFETSDTSAAPTERMRIDHDGNVGIGGTPVSSTRRLMVKDTGDVRVDIRSGADTNLGAIDFSDTSNTARGQLIYDHNDDSMQFKTLSTERMRIDSSGNVGIGTTSPDSLLHLKDPAGTASILRLERSDTTVSTGNGIGIIQFEHKEAGSEGVCAALRVDAGDNSGSGEFVFQTGLADTVTERMRIDSAGNVAIGISSAVARLAVNAGSSPSATYGIANFGASSGVDSYVTVSRGGSDQGGIKILRGSVSDLRIYVNAAESSIINYNGGDTNDGLFFRSGSAETDVMTLDSSGNLLVGTTDSAFVNGGGIKIANATAARLKLCDSNSAGTGSADGFELTQSGLDAYIYQNENSFMAFGTNATERMRIDSSGDLLVGNTLGPLGLISTTTTEGFGVDASETYVAISRSNNGAAIYLNKPGESTSTAGDFIQCRQNGTNIGEIQYDGADLAIVQVSDQRLKSNIVDSASAGSIIDAMQVRSFDWNDGVHVDYGFVAQELNQAYEPATKVGGDDVDEEPWGIKTQKLIPLLVKEIQDLRARVAQLEGA